MKQNRALTKTLFVLLVAVIALACNAVMSAPVTVTPAPTSAPVATKTATLRPTPTKRPTTTPHPTATKAPPTSTPAAKGETVTNGKIEVTVLDMIRHDKVVTGGTYWWTPKSGYIIIDLFIKVKNLKSGSVTMTWGDVHIIGGGGDGEVFAGGWKAATSKEKVAPLSFGYWEVTSTDSFTFDDTVYLQAIYFIENVTQSVLLDLNGAPLIQINK